MTIAYIGNFVPTHSTENHIALTLEDMGQTVYRVQEDEIKSGQFPLPLEAMGMPDLVLWTRTWKGHVTIKMLNELKKMGITTASYHLDLYMGISRELAMTDDPFWQTDFVFTPDGDPKSEAKFRKLGINHHWLPAGVYKKETKKGTYQKKFDSDIAFIGTVWNYHPEWPYRAKLVDYLQNTYGLRFRHYGQKGRPGVRNQDLNDLFASTKIIIGDSLCPHFTHENYWSDRIYETTGRGGFIIHPMIKGLGTQFDIPAELVVYQYNEFEQLKGIIDFYLNNPEIREFVRVKAMKRTRKDHTYHNRMEELLNVVTS